MGLVWKKDFEFCFGVLDDSVDFNLIHTNTYR